MDNLSAKDFLKNRRPEEFSSSTIVEVGTLDRVQLEYYLSTLNIRSQELEFETFAKKLCEKVVCPNLLEQTGPVAGGDGKTDTQTFPVSTQNQLLWYEGINDQSHNERWAFAVSTQKDWKSKCKKDVKKIFETERGYVKVFCISNQSIKADQRSKLEDVLTKEYSIDVRILDLSWILDQIYKNNLEFIAIDNLNIPTFYKKEIELSTDDYQKQKELDHLNKIILEEINPAEITQKQVDYFLEVAILYKELEKPIIDTQGLFDRAIRIANKFGTNHQVLEAIYQYAWAAYWWFEDYTLFLENLNRTFQILGDDTNSENWEKLVNLLTIYHGRSPYSDINETIDIEAIYQNTIIKLDEISKDISRPSNSLMAHLHLYMLQLLRKFKDENFCKDTLKNVLKISQSGNNLIGFPFEKIYNLFSNLDIIFENYEEYDELLDYFTEQSGLRNSEVKIAKLQLERGAKRLENNKPYQAIKLLGKAFVGLNKKETYEEMTYTNLLLSEAYAQIGLRWASRGSLLFSASLLTNYFHKEQIILPATIKVYWQLAWNELELGRIPQSLLWVEIALISSSAIGDNYIDSEKITIFDGCIAHLLLNCSFDQLQEFIYLPDTLDKLQLYSAYGILLYILGYEDKVRKELELQNMDDFLETLFLIRDADIDHPTSKVVSTLGEYNKYVTKVSGCTFEIKFLNKSPFVELAESILTTIENFFSTSVVDNVFTKIVLLKINLIVKNDHNNIISHEFKNSKKGLEVDIYCSNFIWNNLDQEKQKIIFNWFYEFIVESLLTVYHIVNEKDFFEKSLGNDFSASRSIAFSTCFGGTYNVLGKNAFKDVLDILNGNFGSKYKMIRNNSWDFNNSKTTKKTIKKAQLGENKKTPDFEDIESISHDQIGMTTLIKPELWDEASWYGLAFMHFKDKAPVLFLMFKKKEGINVFMDLYQQLGQIDELEKLRFSIIKGVSKANPSYYKVLLTENVAVDEKHKVMTILSRIHKMTPSTTHNWDNFEKEYKKYGSYSISFGAFFNGEFYPYPEFEKFSIKKKELVIKNAWEVGLNDFERMALREDDEPIIPDDIMDIPFLDIFK